MAVSARAPRSVRDPISRVLALVASGDSARASALLSTVVERGAPSPLLAAAAELAFVARDYALAARAVSAALADVNAPRRVLRIAFDLLRRLGRMHEALAVAARASESAPTDCAWALRTAELFVRRGAPERAVEELRRALAVAPHLSSVWLEFAGQLLRTGDLAAAREAASRARAEASRVEADDQGMRSLAFGLELSRVQFGSGDLLEALDVAAATALANPTRAEPHVAMARIALARGDMVTASQGAHEALERDPRSAGALGVLSIVALRAADLTEARRLALRAYDIDRADPDVLTCLGETHIALGDFEEAAKLLDRAVSLSEGFSVAPRVLRSMAVVGRDVLRWTDGDLLSELAPTLRAVGLYDAEVEARHPEAIDRAMSTLVRRMEGNRSSVLTQRHGDAVVVYASSPGARYASRHALGRIETGSADAAFSGFAEVVSRFPTSGLVLCHRGELRLWLGDLVSARRDLDAAIAMDGELRWAYVGLATLELVEGHAERSLEVTALGIARKHGTTGPAVIAQRGEAELLAGNLDAAIADLESALAGSPSRVSARMNLSLAYSCSGREADARREFGAVERQAFALIAETREVLGAGASREAILRHALGMMGGNRSSSTITYFSPDGPMRLVGRRLDARDEAHRDDAALVAEARAIVAAS